MSLGLLWFQHAASSILSPAGVDISRMTITEDMWQRQQRKSQGQRVAQLQARTGRGGGRGRGHDRGRGDR